MPDTTSLKEFVQSVRTRKRYHSQCTPEKTIIITGIFKKKNFFFAYIFNRGSPIHELIFDISFFFKLML